MANEVCFQTLGYEPPWSLETYYKVGGYEAWKRIVRDRMPPDLIIDEVNRVIGLSPTPEQRERMLKVRSATCAVLVQIALGLRREQTGLRGFGCGTKDRKLFA